jgi:hypothetical protein
MATTRTTSATHNASSPDATARKRERDKYNQRRKRDRERTYIAQLQNTVSQLEQELSRCRAQAVSSPSVPSPVVQLAGMLTSTTPPVSAPSLYRRQDCYLVQADVLRSLLGTEEWARLPLWNVVRPNASYRFLNRGEGFVPLRDLLQKNPDLAQQCPPQPKSLDLLYGGSSNLLANFAHAELSNIPYLPPEKFASALVIYRYLRVSIVQCFANVMYCSQINT